jgi:predicted TIM-barrel fold metal-dependent hydrolase
MTFPTDVGVVDLMIGFPDPGSNLDYLKPLFRDEESRNMAFPAEYMFKHVPEKAAAGSDPVEATLTEMDRFNVAIGLITVGSEVSARALREHPDRFVACVSVDPNDITGAVRMIRKAHDDHGIKAVTSFPAGCIPQVPVSDRRYYPVYQTCIDLDIPMIINAGVPGPRVPMKCQHVDHFDEVCYDFPELRIVMRHGAEPWQEMAVKLMLKWPGLYYMPSAFAPRYYPKAIIDFANTRGSEKVMYAGYFPMGLSLERIFSELPGVAFKPEVWPKFLRDNALRVFKLDPPR